MQPLLGKKICIVIENLPAPFDKRVWQEARALSKSGAKVTVLCPKMKGFNKTHEVIDGIRIYRHPLPFEAKRALGYFLEYGTAIFFEFWYLLWITLRHGRQHVIQGCNPPDLIFVPVLPFLLLGTRYVFDHHDLNPELFEEKFGKRGFLWKSVCVFERMTFMIASWSIATNKSVKEIAVRRGKMRPERVGVVRSGPDLDRLKPGPGEASYRHGRKHLIGYLGVIAEQDGLDLLMRIAKLVLSKRQDVHFTIIGDGTELDNVKALAKELDILDHVEFHGMVTDDEKLCDILNACDVCVNPDVPGPLNDLLTTNKVMEYMALGKPVVQFDLKEGRVSAREASLYAKRDDLEDFAGLIGQLLDDPAMRERMGTFGSTRVRETLSWTHERENLLRFYRQVLRIPPAAADAPAGAGSTTA